VVLVVLSGFEAFSIDAHKHKADVLTKVLALIIALFSLEATGAGYTFYNTDGDLAASSVITWTLWGIYDNQKNGRSYGVHAKDILTCGRPSRIHSILGSWFRRILIHLGHQGGSRPI